MQPMSANPKIINLVRMITPFEETSPAYVTLRHVFIILWFVRRGAVEVSFCAVSVSTPDTASNKTIPFRQPCLIVLEMEFSRQRGIAVRLNTFPG